MEAGRGGGANRLPLIIDGKAERHRDDGQEGKDGGERKSWQERRQEEVKGRDKGKGKMKCEDGVEDIPLIMRRRGVKKKRSVGRRLVQEDEGKRSRTW